ncbi:MAG TPA: hypothetical protein VLY46_03350 [Usitatibacter sp.]|nr:hypothetical protein [Usitatibacter sp.]
MNAAPRRRFIIALALSVVAHVLLFTLTPRKPEYRLPLSSKRGPLIVTLVPSHPQVAELTPPTPQATPRPASRPPPRPAKRILTARPNTPQAARPVVVPPEEPKPTAPAPAPAPPATDMLAMLNARRQQRRAAEAAAAAREGSPSPAPVEDEGAAALERNLDSLRDDRTGGIFQILEKDSYEAEYAFNGWTPDTRRRWRQVIDVHVKPGDDIDRAIVRSMIALIRTHYSGDFHWESQRLDRVVTLSARPQDNDYLESFLMREFFNTPMINPEPR